MFSLKVAPEAAGLVYAGGDPPSMPEDTLVFREEELSHVQAYSEKDFLSLQTQIYAFLLNHEAPNQACPLTELAVMRVSELRVNTVHRGRHLLARVVADNVVFCNRDEPVMRLLLLRDPEGDEVLLVITDSAVDEDPALYLPVGTDIAVREPLYSFVKEFGRALFTYHDQGTVEQLSDPFRVWHDFVKAWGRKSPNCTDSEAM